MAERRFDKKLDGGVPVGDSQFNTTTGNVINVVDGLSSDAGLGKPGAPGPYGAVGDGSFPEGSKMPGGSGKAIGAYFGTKNPGGGK